MNVNIHLFNMHISIHKNLKTKCKFYCWISGINRKKKRNESSNYLVGPILFPIRDKLTVQVFANFSEVSNIDIYVVCCCRI